MSELIAAVVFMTIMATINLTFMIWFVGRYSDRVDQESWRKLVCLISEHCFYISMVCYLICAEDILRWFRQLCLVSLLMVCINEFLTLLLYSRLSISHRNSLLAIDPIERAYLRLWDKMYVESFVLSLMGSVAYAVFCTLEFYNQQRDERNRLERIQRWRATMKTVEFQVHQHQDLNSCPICLNDYELASELVESPCGHLFHEQCITSWVKQKSTCPMCRQQLVS